MNNDHNPGEWDVISNRGYVPDELPVPETLRDLMRHSKIQCHGGGKTHTADVCIDCPRYVGARRTDDHRSVEVRCWWHTAPART